MYVPAANAVNEPDITLALLRSAGVGHLVSADSAGALDATLLPFVIDDRMTTIRAHLARANPQWRTLDGATALMLVPVSDAYVSPSWYATKRDDPRVVPTWNYEVVHVHATVHVRDDPAFVESVVRELTELHEAKRVAGVSVPPAWSVDDAPVEFVARQLRAVVGVELSVTAVDAKRKLSQNRSDADQLGVVDGLTRSPDAGDHAVAAAMRAEQTHT